MKTQIITLESHDDLISVRDRMSWAKTPRILLVWPKGEPVDLRLLDLKVLKRHAHALGAQLGIVTRGDAIRRTAQAAGVPVFESSAAAQREAWPAVRRGRRKMRPPRRDLRELRAQGHPAEASWRNSLLTRVSAFAAGVLAVLAISAIFIPRASITLYPESTTQRMVLPVTADPAIETLLSAGSVPAHEEKVVLQGTKSMIVGNRHITIPQTAARGVVRFSNLTQAAISIPAGTVVYVTDDPTVRFKTRNDTVLPAGVEQFVEVPVEAVEKGEQGNRDAGAIQGIDGPLALSARAENLEPTIEGSDRSALGPDDEVRKQALSELVDQLLPEAESEVRSRLGAEVILIEDSGRVSQVLEESYDPPAGQAGTMLKLAARIEFAFRIVNNEDLAKLAEASLNAAMPDDFLPVPGSLTVTQESKPQTDQSGVASWKISAERRLLRNTDAGALLARVGGRPTGVAQAELRNASHWERNPEIRMTPPWWPWLPMIPFRTEMVFQ
jgi:hypothetical protein